MSSPAKNIREKFGQSQQWWAYFLSLSLSQFKMAETDKRSLPTAALLKLSALELLDISTPPATGKATNKKEKRAVAIHKQLVTGGQKMQQQAGRAKQQLATVQRRHQQATNSMAMATQLLKKAAKTEEEKKDRLLLELMQTEATRQLELCGTAAQTFLQWRIDYYTYGAARATELSGQTG